MQRFPVQRMCWIFPGTSSFLNLAGRLLHRCGMWRSPNTNTNLPGVMTGKKNHYRYLRRESLHNRKHCNVISFVTAFSYKSYSNKNEMVMEYFYIWVKARALTNLECCQEEGLMNTRVYSFLLLLLSATKLKQATAGYSKRTVLLLDAIYTNLETTINYPTFCFHLNIKKKKKR